MSAHPGELESALAEVQRRLAALDRRVGALEEAGGQPPAPPAEALAETPAVVTAPLAAFAGLAALLGRSLLALGGAYLLRALTDLGLIPGWAGTLSGLGYAVLWLALAYRAGRGASGHFHGITAVLIGYPLLWEATARFGYLSPAEAAFALAGFTAAALLIAAAGHLRGLAWAASLAATAAALGLFAPTDAPLVFSAFLVALGIATLWLAYDRDLRGLPWATAAAADLALLVATVGTTLGRYDASPATLMALQITFFGLYLGSFAARTLAQGREVGGFEVTQTAVAVLLGFGGAIEVARTTGTGELALGAAGVALGLGSYAIAFTPRIRRDRRRNFFFYSSLGLILVLVGSRLLLPAAGAALAWAVLALLGAGLGGRLGRVTLSLHSAIYLVAAVFESQLAGVAADAFVASASHPWQPLSVVHLAVLAAAAACWLLPAARSSPHWGRLAHLPRLAVLLIAAGALGGALIAVAVPPLAGPPGPGADPGAIAALRTAVLALTAVVLAALGRHERWREAVWLVYPILAAAGLKLVFEDFPHGRPMTLFIAFALLGVALIAASRLGRRESPG